MDSNYNTLTKVSETLDEMNKSVHYYEPSTTGIPEGWDSSDCAKILEVINLENGAGFQIAINNTLNFFAHRTRLTSNEDWSEWDIHE